MEFKKFLQNFDIVFPTIYKLTIIPIVLPIPSGTAERTFLLHKRLVSYLRNRISQDFASNLGLLSIEKAEIMVLVIDKIIDIFAANDNNRRIILN